MGALSGQEYEMVSRIAKALESIAIDLKKMANPILRREDADKLKKEIENV